MKNIFILFFISFINLFAYININPVNFDKRIDNRGEVQEFTLYNPTKNTLKYQLYLSDKDIDNSMKDWIEIFPTTVTLKPGKSGKFKIFAKAPKGIPNGEYLVTLGIKEIALPNLNLKEKNSVQVLTHLKMNLAGYVGELNPKIFLKDFKINLNKNTLKLNGYIANVGKRRGKLNFYLHENKNNNSFYLGNLRLLKGEKIKASKLNQKLTIHDKELIQNFFKYNTLIVKDSLNEKILYKKKIN